MDTTKNHELFSSGITTPTPAITSSQPRADLQEAAEDTGYNPVLKPVNERAGLPTSGVLWEMSQEESDLKLNHMYLGAVSARPRPGEKLFWR